MATTPIRSMTSSSVSARRSTRLGDELKAQTERAERAESALAEARARLEAAPPAAPAPAPQREPDDVEAATSTLVLAKRTAEAAINEARGEANKLLTEARAEADRFVAEARARRDEMMREARDKAEAEFAGQAEARRTEIGELDTAKKGLGDDISILEGRLAEYRKNLSDVHSRLGQLLDDPDVVEVEAAARRRHVAHAVAGRRRRRRPSTRPARTR